MKQQLSDYIGTQRQDMLALKLVLIQSGSYNKSGIDRVVHLIHDTLAAADISVMTIPQVQYGDILLASSRTAGENNNILLIGHTDTVFPQDTRFNWWRDDQEKTRAGGD